MAIVSTASTSSTASLSLGGGLQDSALPQDHRTVIEMFQKQRSTSPDTMSAESSSSDDGSTHTSSSSFFGISWSNRNGGRDKGRREGGVSSRPSMDKNNAPSSSSLLSLNDNDSSVGGGGGLSPGPSPNRARSKREATTFLSRLLPPLSPKKITKPSSTRAAAVSPPPLLGPSRSRTNSVDSALSEDSAVVEALYQGDDLSEESNDTSDNDDEKKRPSLIIAGIQNVVMNLNGNNNNNNNDEGGSRSSGVFSVFTNPNIAEARKRKIRQRKFELLDQLDALDLQLENAKLELHTRKEAFTNVCDMYEQEINDWRERLDTCTTKWLESCEHSALQRKTPLHSYVRSLRRVSCPNYILTLEAQVCQTVHHMCMLEDQKIRQKKNVDTLGKWLMDEEERHNQDKSSLQNGLLRRQFELQDSIRQSREQHEQKLQQLKVEMEQLKSMLWKQKLNDKEWVKEEFLASVSTNMGVSGEPTMEYTKPLKEEKTTDNKTKKKKSHRRTSTYSYSEGLLARSKQSLTTSFTEKKSQVPPSTIPEESEETRNLDLNAIVSEAINGLDDDLLLSGGMAKTNNPFENTSDDDEKLLLPHNNNNTKQRRRRHRRGVTLH